MDLYRIPSPETEAPWMLQGSGCFGPNNRVLSLTRSTAKVLCLLAPVRYALERVECLEPFPAGVQVIVINA
jgi:hypothetical protein